MLECPSCKTPTPTRAGKCVECGVEKPGATKATTGKKQGRKARSTASGSRSNQVGGIVSLLQAAKAVGGIDAAIDTLQAIRAAK